MYYIILNYILQRYHTLSEDVNKQYAIRESTRGRNLFAKESTKIPLYNRDLGDVMLQCEEKKLRSHIMKMFFRWLGLAIISLIGILISLTASINIFSPRTSLDTRKIDKNIEKLRTLQWFNDLYESGRHHKSFFTNLKVRRYLESSIRISALKNNEREQKKFIQLLENVAEVREKNKI